MQRKIITPRNNWQKEVEKLGFGFHSTNIPYWDESAYYEFSMEEILYIEESTAKLWQMCLLAVQHVMDHNMYDRFFIPRHFIPHIEKSWDQDWPSIYARFDLSYKDGQLKMLEINADTPTSLYEAGIVQWYWLQDYAKDKDQFNSIHEKLIEYWGILKQYLYEGPLHFSCVKNSLEDLTTVEYMRDCAIQAKIDTKLIFVDDIGWDSKSQIFVDMESLGIKNIFKLYPYEWLINEKFGENILLDKNSTIWIEPSWKMILSNKAILPVLWSMFPDEPLLLPSYFYTGPPVRLTNYVKKPLLAREGANIEIIKGGKTVESTGGDYGQEGYIIQELAELPNYDGNHALIGSWIIGQQPAGMGIRESKTLITNNTSRFVPHLIKI